VRALGVTEADAVDGGPLPRSFVARTTKVYGVPFASPRTVVDVAGCLPITTRPLHDGQDGDVVTVYELIALPLSAGVTQDTAASAFPAVANTPVGANGGPTGVTGADGPEEGLIPAAFSAFTVKK
jgi:hypothetical protein